METSRDKLPALALCLPALIVGAWLLYDTAWSLGTLVIDSYFYLAKAYGVAHGRGLTLNWGNGFDNKYLPGYSLLLAPFALGAPHSTRFWVWANLAVYGGIVALLLRLARQLGHGVVFALVWAALTLVHRSYLAWQCMPLAEGAALLFGLLALTLALARRAAAAGLALGMAVLCRIEAGVYLPLCALALAGAAAPRDLPAIVWRRRASLVLLGTLAAAPFLCWWATLPSYGAGERLAYVEWVQQQRQSSHQLAEGFWFHLTCLSYPPTSWGGVAAQVVPWLAVVGRVAWLACLGLALAGKLGARAGIAGGALTAYALIHAFWPVHHDRFDILVLPAYSYVLLRGLAWLSGGEAPRKWRAALGWLLLTLWLAAQLNSASRSHADLVALLNSDEAGRDYRSISRRVRALMADTPGAQLLTDLGPRLAALLPERHVYFTAPVDTFHPPDIRPEHALDDLRARGITHVLLAREPLHVLLDAYAVPADDRDAFMLLEQGPTYQVYQLRW